jgi:hypothetical protein
MKKYCKHCGQLKAVEDFNKCSGSNLPRPECKKCKSLYEKQNRTLNKTKIFKAKVAWRIDNPDKVKASNDRAKPYNKQCVKENKEHVLSKNRDWYKAHPAVRAAKSAKRHAMKLQRTPKWLSKVQLFEIEGFYILAKELQWLSNPTDPLEVDHIVPLQGKNVSGLHVPWNLQILPGSLNRSKGNKS